MNRMDCNNIDKYHEFLMDSAYLKAKAEIIGEGHIGKLGSSKLKSKIENRKIELFSIAKNNKKTANNLINEVKDLVNNKAVTSNKIQQFYDGLRYYDSINPMPQNTDGNMTSAERENAKKVMAEIMDRPFTFGSETWEELDQKFKQIEDTAKLFRPGELLNQGINDPAKITLKELFEILTSPSIKNIINKLNNNQRELLVNLAKNKVETLIQDNK
jgi:hypothetical protein